MYHAHAPCASPCSQSLPLTAHSARHWLRDSTYSKSATNKASRGRRKSLYDALAPSSAPDPTSLSLRHPACSTLKSHHHPLCDSLRANFKVSRGLKAYARPSLLLISRTGCPRGQDNTDTLQQSLEHYHHGFGTGGRGLPGCCRQCRRVREGCCMR